MRAIYFKLLVHVILLYRRVWNSFYFCCESSLHDDLYILKGPAEIRTSIGGFTFHACVVNVIIQIWVSYKVMPNHHVSRNNIVLGAAG